MKLPGTIRLSNHNGELPVTPARLIVFARYQSSSQARKNARKLVRTHASKSLVSTPHPVFTLFLQPKARKEKGIETLNNTKKQSSQNLAFWLDVF